MEEVLTTHVCKSCGNSFTGNYCNQCGERVLTKADRSFQKLATQIFSALTLADNKFASTLWLMVKNPGFISKEFTEGRTVKYMRPISIFFVLNLVYFLFPTIQLFNASLNTQMRAPYAGFIREIIVQKMMSTHILNVDSFSIVYDQKSTALAKLLVMVFVIIASLPLNFIYKKRNRYFNDHFGYCIELACFNLVINTLLLKMLIFVLGIGHYVDDFALTSIFIVTNLYFLVRSGSTFYNQKGWQLFLKSVIMILFLKVALEVYRAILFFLTILSL
jgi:DNA-directed RNA polymerase subunit RPC12/RpoP